MIETAILGAAVCGPGLDGWVASRPVLTGAAPYEARPCVPPPPDILPPTERRRAGPVIRLALAAAADATEQARVDPGLLRGVFASSSGDAPVVGAILDSLTVPGGAVSPTQFHNSVHNAAAGYWSIAGRSAQPATCIGCHDATWAAGLLAAAVDAVTSGAPVLLCAYDHPLPPPLDARRPTVAPFAAALVLAPVGALPGGSAGTMARLAVRHAALPAPPDAGLPRQAALHPLARGNAAAQALRLLESLARGQADAFPIAYLDGRLEVELRPCSTAPA